MPLPFLALGLSGAIGGLKYFQGRRQMRRAERIRQRAQQQLDENPYQTPMEALRALNLAETQAAQTRLPGQDLIEAQIQAGAGGALQAQRETGATPQEVAAGASQAYQSLYINPLRGLGVQAAQQQAAAQQNLQAQLGNIAQYRDKEYQQNVLLPYQRAMQTAGQLAVAGQQNRFAGISDIAGGIGNFGLQGGFGKIGDFLGSLRLGAPTEGDLSLDEAIGMNRDILSTAGIGREQDAFLNQIRQSRIPTFASDNRSGAFTPSLPFGGIQPMFGASPFGGLFDAAMNRRRSFSSGDLIQYQ